jgi:hypothetical protein
VLLALRLRGKGNIRLGCVFTALWVFKTVRVGGLIILEEKMKKVLLVLVAFMLIFAVVGCNNGSSGSLKPFAKFGPEDVVDPNEWFNEAVGMTTGIAAQGSGKFDDGVLNLGQGLGGSSLFTLKLPGKTSESGTKNITITYACVVDAGEAKVILKNGAWGDIKEKNTSNGGEANWYPSLESGKVSTLVLKEKWYVADTDTISFQANDDGNSSAKWRLKIISVKLE